MSFFASSQTVSRLLLSMVAVTATLYAAEPVPAPVTPAVAPVVAPAGTAPAAVTPAPAPPVPFLGVRFDENSVALDHEPGMPINEVVAGSTAQVLGLEAGDRLLTVNGKAVEKPDQLKAVLGGAKVGDPITVESSRAGKHLSASGTLNERPKPAALAKEVDRLNQKLAEVKDLAAAQKREPSLAEILQQLKDIETGLPRAVAAFKQQYPNGDFDIRIQVVITSDRTAANPIELSNAQAASKPADDKKNDGKTVDGKPVDGKTVDGKLGDSKPAPTPDDKMSPTKPEAVAVPPQK